MRIPKREQNPRGLHRRYTIARANGTPVDPAADYFVLRIDPNGSDLAHVRACRRAARAYARCVLRDARGGGGGAYRAPSDDLRRVAAELNLYLDRTAGAWADRNDVAQGFPPGTRHGRRRRGGDDDLD